mmetsp:Transcript_6989/g.17167  ORF Transcript_6989/g.17167 Transcript_6989/m.17167 type:complete len:230 (+) Transcript_6989:421-1110(+)
MHSSSDSCKTCFSTAENSTDSKNSRCSTSCACRCACRNDSTRSTWIRISSYVGTRSPSFVPSASAAMSSFGSWEWKHLFKNGRCMMWPIDARIAPSSLLVYFQSCSGSPLLTFSTANSSDCSSVSDVKSRANNSPPESCLSYSRRTISKKIRRSSVSEATGSSAGASMPISPVCFEWRLARYCRKNDPTVSIVTRPSGSDARRSASSCFKIAVPAWRRSSFSSSVRSSR